MSTIRSKTLAVSLLDTATSSAAAVCIQHDISYLVRSPHVNTYRSIIVRLLTDRGHEGEHSGVAVRPGSAECGP